MSAASWLTTEAPATAAQARLGAILLGLRRLLGDVVGRLGCGLVGGLCLLALLAPWLPLADPNAQSLAVRLLPPSGAHWFGTDAFGRDQFARVLLGLRPTCSWPWPRSAWRRRPVWSSAPRQG